MPENRKRRVVGTAGHIDHGKTALVRALTGVDCDRLPEEKRRGITIDLGFANWVTSDLQISFIDVPGHERFVKNMLAGVGGIDSTLLVVAADESIKPQTREHFAICKLLRIPTGVVAVTKTDLVDTDIVEIVRLEIEEMVRGSFLEGHPIVPVSSVTGDGVEALRDALVETVRGVADRDATRKVFRLPIDRAFTIKGFGSVVTGTAISGELEVDSEVDVLPAAGRSRARNIQVHNEPRARVSAGERVSVNLADLPLESLRRGEQVTTPGTLRPSQVITASLELLPDAPPLKDQTRIRFHHFAAELLGSIRIVDGSGAEIPRGGKAYVQVRLESPVIAVAGDRFVIRRYSPSVTIGGGQILDAHLPKFTRNTRREIFTQLENAGLAERLSIVTRLAGLRGTSLDDLQTQTGVRKSVLRQELRHATPADLVEVPDAANPRWIHSNSLSEFRRKAMEFLRGYFDRNRVAVAVPKGEFIQKLLPSVDQAVVDYLLADLVKERILIVNGDALDIPGRSKELGGAEGELARLIEKRFREGELSPPPVSELIKTIQQKAKVIEGVVGYLVKTGRLVRLADGVYLHHEVVHDAKRRIAEHSGETIDVAWFKDFFGISRKVAIPLLELLDRDGVTKRIGDQRLVR